MPILHVTNEDGDLTALAPAIVQAVITYPDPEDPRQLQMLASVGSELLVYHPETFEEESRALVALELIPHVYTAPEPSVLRKRARTYAQHAWVAGEMLPFLLSAAIHHPERSVTVTKALSVLRTIFRGEETWGGKKINLSGRGAWEAWSRFKPVSHFYAFRQIQQDQLKEAGVGPEQVEEQIARLFTEDLLSDLAVVEALRRAAVERKILDFEEAWRLPDNIRLPPEGRCSTAAPSISRCLGRLRARALQGRRVRVALRPADCSGTADPTLQWNCWRLAAARLPATRCSCGRPPSPQNTNAAGTSGGVQLTRRRGAGPSNR